MIIHNMEIVTIHCSFIILVTINVQLQKNIFNKLDFDPGVQRVGITY